jgi:hypothetical protein
MTGLIERRPKVARRKSYQKGTVFKRGQKGNLVWVGRWWRTASRKTARTAGCADPRCSAPLRRCVRAAKPNFTLTATSMLQSSKPFSFLLVAPILGGIGVPIGVP